MIGDGTGTPRAGAPRLRSALSAQRWRTAARDAAIESHRRVTSAQWRMVEALARSRQPLTAPQIAARVGCTRQGAQKQLNLLMQTQLVQSRPNPLHKRSRLYVLTELGKQGLAEAALGRRRSGARGADRSPRRLPGERDA